MNMFSGRVITGGMFSLRMSPGFASKEIVKCYLIWAKPGTSYHPSNIVEREPYVRGIVCFGVASLCVDTETSMSF